MNGIINVYKEKGFTSFDVCAKLRGILKTKKIGHTGTLDPEAEGVLPVCVGNATKLCDLLTDKDKVYEAVLKLGVTTDTQDMTGTIITTSEITSDKETVLSVIRDFVGTYEQIPPMYSAIKVNGQKLYELARKGIEVERKGRPVTIHSIDVLDMITDDNDMVSEVKMQVACSKGTYIRTLCADIGEQLGCGGCMKSLLRTKVSVFLLKDSLKLSEIEEKTQDNKTNDFLKSVDSLFMEYPKGTVSLQNDRFLKNGNKLKKEQIILEADQLTDGMQVRVYDHKEVFTGIYCYKAKEASYCPVKMFL